MKFRDIILSSAICGFFCWVLTTVIIGSGGVSQSSITLDLARHRIVAAAVLQYATDNDMRFPPTETTGTMNANGASGDRVWPQLVLAYHGDMANYRDPDNPVTFAQLMSDLPSCTNSPIQCEFNLSVKSHRGFNFQYLSPLFSCDPEFRPVPGEVNSVGNASRTILAVDSVWNRRNGVPVGGGNWRVDPPARFTVAMEDTLPRRPDGCSGRWWNNAWAPSQPLAANRYGGAFYYHKQNTAAVSFVDGHVAILNMTQLAAGATVLDLWGGRITDRDAYLWDLQ